MAGALLDGIRIPDLTAVIMGPLATHTLADPDADAIKIDPPDGDATRTYPPHRAPGISGSFLNLNRNKRSVVLPRRAATDKFLLEMTTCD